RADYVRPTLQERLRQQRQLSRSRSGNRNQREIDLHCRVHARALINIRYRREDVEYGAGGSKRQRIGKSSIRTQDGLKSEARSAREVTAERVIRAYVQAIGNGSRRRANR